MRVVGLLLCFFLLAAPGRGQDDLPSDTIALAQLKIDAGDHAGADRLLTQYASTRNDVDAFRLHAHLLVKMHEYTRAADMFEKGIAFHPDVHVLKLDHGRFLFDRDERGKAGALLQEYLHHDSMNAEAHILLTYLDWKKGNNQAARKRSARLLEWYPDNPDIQELAEQVFEDSGTTVKAGYDHLSDDQPITADVYHVAVEGVYSPLFSPKVSYRTSRFNISPDRYATQWLRAGNSLRLAHTRTIVDLSAGLFQHQSPQHTTSDPSSAAANRPGINYEFTGSLQVTQTISHSFGLAIGAERMPYQFSMRSIQNPLLYDIYKAAVQFNRSERWLGEAAYEVHRFDGGGQIEMAYVWSLAPLFKNKWVDLKIGYAFGYADADMNRLEPLLPPGMSMMEFAQSEQPIPGIFDPYFSPSDQFVHSVLATAGLRLSKRIVLTGKASVGVYAIADIPYLYWDLDQTNSLIMDKGYARETYRPMTFGSELRIRCSRRLWVSGSYVYNSLLFYISHEAGFQLKYHF